MVVRVASSANFAAVSTSFYECAVRAPEIPTKVFLKRNRLGRSLYLSFSTKNAGRLRNPSKFALWKAGSVCPQSYASDAGLPGIHGSSSQRRSGHLIRSLMNVLHLPGKTSLRHGIKGRAQGASVHKCWQREPQTAVLFMLPHNSFDV